jgi:hypothetical protein
MFFIDFRAAGRGQISDKYQYYGRNTPSMARPPVHQNVHLAQENRLLA